MAGPKKKYVLKNAKEHDYIVYKTINNINNKYYIGSHFGLKSKDIFNDNYLGSGLRIRAAVEKYGRVNFTREVLHICSDLKDMFDKEKKEITKHISAKDCYNINPNPGGGDLGIYKYKPFLQLSPKGEVVARYDAVTLAIKEVPQSSKAWEVARYLVGKSDVKKLNSAGFIWVQEEDWDNIIPERWEEAIKAKRPNNTLIDPIFCLIMDVHLHKDNIGLIRKLFKQVIEECKSRSVRYIFQAGDIFDSRSGLEQEVMVAFSDILKDLADNGITIYAMPGNHDKGDLESESSWLDIWEYHPNFRLIRDSLVIDHLHSDFDFAFLPYFPETGSYIKRLEELSKQVGNKPTILITHIGINGALSHKSETAKEVPPSIFKKFHKVYVAHYHNENEVDDQIHYLGSLYAANFGEDNNKGICFFKNNGDTDKVILDFPKYITQQVNVKDLSISEMQVYKSEELNKGDYLRVQLTGDKADLKALNKQQLNDLGIKVQMKPNRIEKQELEERVEAHDSASLEEAFEKFCEDRNLDHSIGLKYFNQIQFK